MTASADEIRRVFALQRAYQYTAKTSTAAQRKEKLLRLKAAIEANTDAVCEAMYADLRRSRQMAIYGELHGVLNSIDEAVAHLDAWMSPVEIEPAPTLPGKSQIRYEARGQVLVLGPWNFPIGLVLSPIVPAIAAGNVVIAKPNEMSAQSSAITAKILREAFDERDVAVFEGGIETANQLLELPFNHVFFTGSPAVGRVVMAAAAKHLASVTLELGGKNPVVIDAGADLVAAAGKIAAIRTMNSGQLCLCPDNVWVHRSVRDQFVGIVSAVFQKMYFVDGKLNGDALGKIVDDRNFARVTSYIDDARARGAKVAFGGGNDPVQRLVEPTVLVDVPVAAKVMQDEIFGPILPVNAFDDIGEVIDYLHARGKPLAAYIYSNDEKLVDRFIGETSSGGVTVNDILSHASDASGLPFGGVNDSGIGAYHGIHGFRELSHARSVFSAAPK
ncbi:MAG: aldehyde dehydrogenase family protein [Spongiibacteraceae bacterium]